MLVVLLSSLDFSLSSAAFVIIQTNYLLKECVMKECEISQITSSFELSSVVRLDRRTTEDSSSGRIMRLVPVFTLDTNNRTNNECLPKFVQTHNASSRIKAAVVVQKLVKLTNEVNVTLH